MICDRCGAKVTKKAARLHPDICPKRPRRRRRPPGRYAGSPAPRRNWAQLDLFDDFLRRGQAAQAAVDAIIGKNRRCG